MANSNVLLTSYTTAETPAIPTWDTNILNQSTEESSLPGYYDASQHVSSNAGQSVTYDISPPVSGITIDPVGLIKCAVGTAVDVHNVTVTAANATGSATPDQTFTWTVFIQPTVPTWDSSPQDQSDPDNTLPQTYDVSGLVTSNAGQAITWSLENTSSDFEINAGVITAKAGTAIGAHSVTVRAVNATGPAVPDQTFTWTITEADTVPQPIQAYPPINSYVGVDIGGVDLGAAYWSSNNAQPVTYAIDQLPNLLSMDPNTGVVTGTPDTEGPVVCTVTPTNGTGPAVTPGTFTWTILAAPTFGGGSAANKLSISIDIGV